MSTANVRRWSGLVSLLAGLLYALGAFLHPVGEDLAAINSPNWVPAHLVYWVSAILMLFGLVGLYARQARKTGWLGLLSFVLAFLGTILVGSILIVSATLIPLIAAEAPAILEEAIALPAFMLPVFVLGFGLGYVLFGMATMRAGTFPRWSGLLLIVGVSLFMISEVALSDRTLSHLMVTVGDVLFGLGFVWMGNTLWLEKREVSKGSLRPGLN